MRKRWHDHEEQSAFPCDRAEHLPQGRSESPKFIKITNHLHRIQSFIKTKDVPGQFLKNEMKRPDELMTFSLEKSVHQLILSS